MALLIEDEDVVREVHRRAADLHLSPVEVIRRAVQVAPAEGRATVTPETVKRRRAAISEAQAWFAAHGDPNDRLAPDEIIGYNAHGYLD